MGSLFQPGYLPAMTLARKTFIGSTTNAGVAVPAYNATGQVFGLWNPYGSDVNIILVKLCLGIATLGTEVQAALGLSALYATGSQVATGSPITSFTQTPSLPGLIGDGNGAAGSSKGRFTLSATMTAPTFVYNLSMAEAAGQLAAASATPGLTWHEHNFDGAIGVAPGTYVGLGGSAAPGSTFQASLVWMEVPV
jgi:hypothetical protein